MHGLLSCLEVNKQCYFNFASNHCVYPSATKTPNPNRLLQPLISVRERESSYSVYNAYFRIDRVQPYGLTYPTESDTLASYANAVVNPITKSSFF